MKADEEVDIVKAGEAVDTGKTHMQVQRWTH